MLNSPKKTSTHKGHKSSLEFDKSADNKPKRMPMAAVVPKGIIKSLSRQAVGSLTRPGSVSPPPEKIPQRGVNYLANCKRTPQKKELRTTVNSRIINLESYKS